MNGDMETLVERLNEGICVAPSLTGGGSHIDIPATEAKLREAASAIQALIAERNGLRAKLFPYAAETQISGMSWGGFYLIGNDKSIKELKRVTHRSGQLEQFSAAYEDSVARERARAEASEARAKELGEVLEGCLRLLDEEGWGSGPTGNAARAALAQEQQP